MKVSKIFLDIFYITFFLLFFPGLDTKGIFQYTSEIMALSCIVLVFGGLISRKQFSMVPNKHIVMLHFTIFIFIICEYLGWSYYPSVTKIYIIRYIFYTPLVLFCIRTENILKLIGWSKYYLMLISVVFIVQYPFQGVNGSFLGSYQNVAAAMCFGLLFCISDLLTNQEYTWRNILCFMTYLGTLLMTGKRTFAVIPLIILIIFLLFMKNGIAKKIRWKRFSKIIFVCVVLGGIILVVYPDLLSSITRILETKDDDGLNGRAYLWNLAMYHWQNNRVKGIGLGSYATFITENLSFTYQLFGVQRAYAVHNIYLQLLAETGIVGTVLYIVFFTCSLVFSLKTLKLACVGNNSKWLRCTLVSIFIQIWFLVYGLTGNPLFVPSQFYAYLFAIMMTQSVNWEIQHLEGRK